MVALLKLFKSFRPLYHSNYVKLQYPLYVTEGIAPLPLQHLSLDYTGSGEVTAYWNETMLANQSVVRINVWASSDYASCTLTVVCYDNIEPGEKSGGVSISGLIDNEGVYRKPY